MEGGFIFRIISISWGINAPEDGGLSRLPHIIEKIPPFFTQGLTIVLLLPVFVTEVADRIETQLLLPRIVTGPQLPNKVMVLLLPLIVTDWPLQVNV